MRFLVPLLAFLLIFGFHFFKLRPQVWLGLLKFTVINSQVSDLFFVFPLQFPSLRLMLFLLFLNLKRVLFLSPLHFRNRFFQELDFLIHKRFLFLVLRGDFLEFAVESCGIHLKLLDFHHRVLFFLLDFSPEWVDHIIFRSWFCFSINGNFFDLIFQVLLKCLELSSLRVWFPKTAFDHIFFSVGFLPLLLQFSLEFLDLIFLNRLL